jgi:16S rRNA processing protein RimM
MSHPQLTEIGTITKTHGIKGEVQVSWTNSFDLDEQKLESVFLQIEGIPIPFLVKSIRGKGAEDALILFNEVESIDEANELVGLKIFAEIKRKKAQSELYLDDLVGFSIISNKGVLLGQIEHLQDFSGNLVFQVMNNSGHELLIPATPDFILDLDEGSKTLVMEIPEGLAEL